MKKFWKIIKYLAAVFLFALIADAALLLAFSVSRPMPEKADAIVILGAAINTPALYNRSLHGLELYQKGKGRVLVLSGGKISDSDISEAEYMKKVILENSQAEPQMILESNSHNTLENLQNTRAILPEAKSLIIVSDSYHLARAYFVAKSQGFQEVYWSAPSPFYYRPGELAYYYFREAVALFAYLPKLF